MHSLYSQSKLIAKILLVVIMITFNLAIFQNVALADNAITSRLSSAGQGMNLSDKTGKPNVSMTAMIGKVIQVLLSIVGVILLIIIIYAGVLWMTAGGEADQVKKAKNMLQSGVMGLFIIVIAYALSTFVMSRIMGTVTPTEQP